MTRKKSIEELLDSELLEVLVRPMVDLNCPAEASNAMSSKHSSIGPVNTSNSARIESNGDSHVEIFDFAIESSYGVIPIRRYRPSISHELGATILLFHGGAFIGGDAGTEHERCLSYVINAGATVIVPEYRLAPKHKFPAALEDCQTVLDWALSQISEDEPPRKKLIIAGVSAGGALAAGLLLKEDVGSLLSGLMLLCPVLDDRTNYPSMEQFTSTPIWDSRNNAVMWELYLNTAEADKFSAPARATSLNGFPRTYVQVAELDPLRDEGLAFANGLVVAEVPTDLRMWAGTCHVFDQVVPNAEVSRRSIADQVEFILRVGKKK